MNVASYKWIRFPLRSSESLVEATQISPTHLRLVLRAEDDSQEAVVLIRMNSFPISLARTVETIVASMIALVPEQLKQRLLVYAFRLDRKVVGSPLSFVSRVLGAKVESFEDDRLKARLILVESPKKAPTTISALIDYKSFPGQSYDLTFRSTDNSSERAWSRVLEFLDELEVE